MKITQNKHRVISKKFKQVLVDAEELLRFRYSIVNAKSTDRCIKDMMKLVEEELCNMTPEQAEHYSISVQRGLLNPDRLAAVWPYYEMEDHYEEV